MDSRYEQSQHFRQSPTEVTSSSRSGGGISGISGVVDVVCDAVRSFTDDEDVEAGLIRLNEALAGLEQAPDGGATGIVGRGPVDLALTAIVDLAKAQEAVLEDNTEEAERLIRSGADHLVAAADAVRRSRYTINSGEMGDQGSSVQLSVPEASRVPNEEAILESLRNLLARSESKAFVIFVDAQTGNFCQFIGSKGAPLLLDLPFTFLDADALGRARRYFAERGYEGIEGDEGFSIDLGRDVRAATALALGTFTKVYGAEPNFSLKIEEN